MKTKEIRDLIEFIAGTGLNEVNIETEELKISVKRQPDFNTKVIETVSSGISTAQSTPAKPNATEDVSASNNQPSDSGQYVEIKSPMIGTFYRSANPESEPFINIGDSVTTGKTVCIIEAMKLFNEIESELSGKIVELLVEDGTPVEYDQPLFLVDPL